MIPFDFEYHRPDTAKQASETFMQLRKERRDPYYYGGGTEILTMSRLNQITPKAVVDLKAIPETRALEQKGDDLVLGANRTLAELCEADVWPLMSAVAGRVADHTTRCKITLGGHIAGQIEYHEALLPLLLADAKAVVSGPGGTDTRPLTSLFQKALSLEEGAFILQVEVPSAATRQKHASEKRTRLDWVDYPLVTVAAQKDAGGIRVAFSGVCAFPFRSEAVERDLNAPKKDRRSRIEAALAHLPAPIVDDLHGSAAYRRFILADTLDSILKQLEE